MAPTLLPSNLVVATDFYRDLLIGDIVIFQHQGMDKIKRIEDIRGSEVYVLGDNPSASKDSRSFGWIPTSLIKAKVIWPKTK